MLRGGGHRTPAAGRHSGAVREAFGWSGKVRITPICASVRVVR
jgi:hypothetical protein